MRHSLLAVAIAMGLGGTVSFEAAAADTAEVAALKAALAQLQAQQAELVARVAELETRTDAQSDVNIEQAKTNESVVPAVDSLKKLVNEVEHVTFSGPRGVAQGQDITYVTERCVMKLTPEGILLTEIAPGVDLQAHILDQSEFPLIVSPDLKVMDARLFTDAPIGLTLPEKAKRRLAGVNHG